MLGRGPAGVVAPALRFGDSNGFRTTPAAAAGCCLPLLVQGAERHFHLWGWSPAACAAPPKIPL